MGCINEKMVCFNRGNKFEEKYEKYESNLFDHRTDVFEWSGMVFRRGKPFIFKFPLKFHNSSEQLILDMSLKTTGYKPLEYRISTKNSTNPIGWNLYIRKDIEESCLYIRLTTPSNIPIGSYCGLVYINRVFHGELFFVVLFNPWNCDDTVYYPSDDKLKEYVLSAKTIIYMGTECSIINKEWYLGQFKTTSMEACIYLLNRIASFKRANPVDVCRALSALVNSNDDNGVVMGNWTGDYADGIDPNTWIGSAEILRKYIKSKQPVKYGQCWVFAGVLCSVLRCLGLPTRCVTNYQSFHDSDGSMKWEVYFDENFNCLNISRETCWNYHCWNEVWMNRDDLGGGRFNGWQVVDATPQERSSGLFQLGPASRYAVKKGFIGASYDTGFVFAEVSADRIYFIRQKNGKFKHYLTQKGEVGKLICTKKVGCKERKDLTRFYKDGTYNGHSDINETTSINERIARETVRHKPTQPITIVINAVSDYTLGSSLSCSVTVFGLKTPKNIYTKMKIYLVSYNGKHVSVIYGKSHPVNGSNNSFTLSVKAEEILTKMTPACSYIKCTASCLTTDDQFAHKEMLINVCVPKISFERVPEAVYVGEQLKLRFKIHNPLTIPLTQVKVYIECDALFKRQTYKFESIEPLQTLRHKVVLVMRLAGYKTIFANIKCREFSSLSSSTEIVVIRKYTDTATRSMG